MVLTTHPLSKSDYQDVLAISNSVWETDYIPEAFLKWLDDPHWTPIGVFDDEKLVSVIALDEQEDGSYANVKALRTHSDNHGKGYGLVATKAIVELAKEKGVRDLRYCTSSRNKASMKVATKAGFSLKEQVGYARVEQPVPAHPKPSIAYIPVEVSAERIMESLTITPDLIERNLIPVAWDFEDVSLEGFKRLESETTFKLVVDEVGKPVGLFITYSRERSEIRTASYTVFSIDQSIFIDIISRILDEVENKKINRCAFFLDSRGKEWIYDMGIIPEDWEPRDFLLYQLKF